MRQIAFAASRRFLSTILRACQALALVGALLGPGLATPRQVVAAPSGLPDHFGFGLNAPNDASGIGGWMPDSKIPWDYAYQYLAGGANTGHGWATWNDKAQFPLYYAKGAASHGYIPIFTYYQLLQSNGPCAGGCGELQRDMGHLNDPATMQGYFSDFTTLMKRLGPGNYDGVQGFGQTAIVHIEPDLSGFAEQASQLGDPTTVPAAVASTGNPDVAAFPNTFQGFNWALLALRDKYAPNVLLAYHVSVWATGTDIGSSHDPALDAADIGAKTGAFAAASGVSQAGPGTSTYDLIFNDVLDRDAGFYKYANNDGGRWWDRLNLTYPNFQRWEQWLGSANRAAGGKPVIIWQIPLGNQYFQTENNTPGHYQDNRAEYFFGHLDELRQVGIIGLLFGGGGGNVTSFTDANKDGVTNPPAFCTNDGVGTGQVCNNHASTVSDDDGGYIRMMAQQYYSNPLALGALPTGGGAPSQSGPASTPSSSVPSGPLAIDLGASQIDPPVAAPGDDVTLRQNTISTSDATVMVDFQLFDANGQQVFESAVPDQHVLLGMVTSSSTSFNVGNLQVGRYTLKVGVFSPDGATQYVWNDAAATLIVR